MLAYGLAMKLNGHASSANLIDTGHGSSSADSNSNQNAIADSGPLFTRTFKVNPLTFSHALDNAAPQNGKVLALPIVSAKAIAVFSQFGVNFLIRAGKSIFFNKKLGLLFAKSTESDLDAIECAMGVLNQTPSQIHIKAQFLSVPKGTLENLATP